MKPASRSRPRQRKQLCHGLHVSKQNIIRSVHVQGATQHVWSSRKPGMHACMQKYEVMQSSLLTSVYTWQAIHDIHVYIWPTGRSIMLSMGQIYTHYDLNGQHTQQGCKHLGLSAPHRVVLYKKGKWPASMRHVHECSAMWAVMKRGTPAVSQLCLCSFLQSAAWLPAWPAMPG